MPEWKARVRERLAGLRLDPATETDTIEELTQHVEDRYNDLLARGMTAADAEVQACRELDGDERLAREISRARTALPMAPVHDTSHAGMQGVLDDLWFAWRRLWHVPWFTVAALVTVTLTVGVNTAMLSVADAVLFRPLPYADPDGVAIVQMHDRKSGSRYAMTPYAAIEALSDCCSGVSEIALIDGGPTAPTVWIDTPVGPDPVPAVAVTANYFSVLGVLAVRGRVFTEHDTGGEGRTALLSHAGWLRLFGGDESIIGQPVTLGTSTFEIVGVLPRGFVFPSVFAGRPDLVLLREPVRPGATGGTLPAIVRLAPAVSRAQAQAEIDAATSTIAASLGREDSGPILDDVRTVLYPIGRPVMRYLLVATGLILLLGCANLSNMLLVRGRRGLHETAVRLALGATPMRLVRPIVFEALLVGAAGALLAVGFTSLVFEALVRQVPPAVYGAAPVGVDFRIVMFALLMGLGSALIVGLVPAWRAAGMDVLVLMQRRGGRAARVRLGRPMLAAQVAIAVAVVFGAAVAGRAFVSLVQTPLGFSADRVLRIRMMPPPDVKDRQQFYERAVHALRAFPEVEAGGAAGMLPFGNQGPDDSAHVPGEPQPVAGIAYALPGYFETASIPILLGRSLAWDDVRGEPNAAVVSESVARVLFPDREPLGGVFENRRGRQFVVIGVAADVRDLSSRFPVPLTYVIPGSDARLLQVLARTRGRSEAVRAAISAEMARLGPARRPTVEWWADSISAMHVYRDPRFQTLVLGTLAALALGLTALGIFSVVAYFVSARTHEMGVRLAIGASPRSLVRLVVGQSLLPVAAGVGAGLVLVFLMRGLIEAQLASVEARDPVMLAAAIVTVAAAALGAAYLPARRVTQVNPTEVLRAE